jgi:hypothetical protein
MSFQPGRIILKMPCERAVPPRSNESSDSPYGGRHRFTRSWKKMGNLFDEQSKITLLTSPKKA